MSKLYVVGCSHTRYCWPTYADILAQEFDEYENWGQSGFGNYAIMHRAIEIADKMSDEDELIVQWTYPTRFDFHRGNAGWYQGGNLANNNDAVQDTINKYCFDKDSYEWHTQMYIKLVMQYLDINVYSYKMIAPDFEIECVDNQSLPQLNTMDNFDIPFRKFFNTLPSKKFVVQKQQDAHWTPRHHLEYLKQTNFAVTDKMIEYVDKVEKILDETDDWKLIHYKMAQQNYIETNDYGR